MKHMINFTTSQDDLDRYETAEELQRFYASFGCDGLELMPIEGYQHALIQPGMVQGIHMCCIDNWIDMDRDEFKQHCQKDLDAAKALGTKYVVFHVSQMTWRETLGEPFTHTDEEVVDATCEVINDLFDGQDYDFWFLMENMWYPGLTFQRPEILGRLIRGIRYEKKGFMFDTGHFMHTNLDLKTQEDAIEYILDHLGKIEEYLPYIKGIHLNQSLTGDYVREFMANRPPLEEDPQKLFCQAFAYIFKVDLHQPFTVPEIQKVIEKIQPEFLTYEYITDCRETHARYLAEGRAALGDWAK